MVANQDVSGEMTAAMPQILNTTLVADGSSDRVLIPIIGLLLQAHCPFPFRETDFVQQYPEGMLSLVDRIRHAVRQYPCDMLFVHRDAEQKGSVQLREQEVQAAVAASAIDQPTLAVIPVRMTEAWLLVDEVAIRLAAGNPRGLAPLNLPKHRQMESVDAKAVLFAALEQAKNLGKRRTQDLRPQYLRHRVAENFDDLAPLRRLPSFAKFEAKLRGHFQSSEFVNA